MTSPPQQIRVRCPSCDAIYRDWWRPSLNFGIESFDEDYVREATSATCPRCGTRVAIESLVVDEAQLWTAA